MNYQELYDEVVALTNRPDLVAETASAVKSATLRCHQFDFFARDVLEQNLVLSQNAFMHQFDVNGVFARFRALKYVRKYNPSGVDSQTQQPTGAAGIFFDIIDPEQALDSYNANRLNMCYVAGSLFNLRSSTSLQNLLCGWYANPIITTDGYSSWIAQTVPYAIVFDATSLVFQMIGFQEQSRKFDALVKEQMAMVQMHGLTGRGY